jgi:hypothetical protein
MGSGALGIVWPITITLTLIHLYTAIINFEFICLSIITIIYTDYQIILIVINILSNIKLEDKT